MINFGGRPADARLPTGLPPGAGATSAELSPPEPSSKVLNENPSTQRVFGKNGGPPARVYAPTCQKNRELQAHL